MLDYLRAKYNIAESLKISPSKVHNVIVWGNHSDSQVPDATYSEFEDSNGTRKKVIDVLDREWEHNHFQPSVRNRGYMIFKLITLSSAAGAARAASYQMSLWINRTPECEIVPFGIYVPESQPYGIKPGVFFSFPCTIDKEGNYHIVENLEVSNEIGEALQFSYDDLISEKHLALE